MKNSERALFLALLVSFALWNLPFGAFVLYPFKLLATWLHEMCHGLAMALSGAGFHDLQIFEDTSGMARAAQGVGNAGRAVIACSGYMGTAAIGALMLVLGQSRRGARIVLYLLAGLLAISAALLISNDFGVIAAAAGASGAALLALWPDTSVARYTLNFVAAQSSANAVLDIRVLFRSDLIINGKASGSSDAHNMASATLGTPTVWASVWLLFSIAVLYVALRLLYLRGQR